MSVDIEEDVRRRGLLPLVETIARRHHVTARAVLGRDRHQSVATARIELYRELAATTNLSLAEIARMLGRDPTTVLKYASRARLRVA